MEEGRTVRDGEGPGTRERIVAAAARIIVERGVGGLRIRELARAVGIREGSIYNHFSGRDDIIKALFQTVDSRLSPLGTVLDLSSAPPDQVDQVRGLIRSQGLGFFLEGSCEHLIRHFNHDPEALRLIRAVLGARFHDASAKAAYEDVLHPDMVRVFGAFCRIAAEEGVLKAGVRPESLAKLIAITFEHGLGESGAEGGADRFAAALRDSLRTIAALATP